MRYLLILCLFFSCSKKETHFQGVAHTHPYHIQIGKALSKKEEKEIWALLEKTFEEVDLLYNHWNKASLLCTNPNAKALTPILTLAHSFKALTRGRYNPLLGIPIHTFKTNQTGTCCYDLDGMLKGYVIDQIVETLSRKGYTDLYVEWSGDLRVLGHHPSGRKWQVLIGDEIIALDEGAIATSGSDKQIWEKDGKKMSHIFNPTTYKMVEVKEGHLSFVTVYAPTCALADALATAGMACETQEEAILFAQKMKEKKPVDFWIGTWQSKP